MNCPVCYKELTLLFGKDEEGNIYCKYVCESEADPHFVTDGYATPELAAQEVISHNESTVMTTEETIEQLARGVCIISANKGDCDHCGFSKDKSCSNYRIAKILYNKGFRKTTEETKGRWILQYNDDYDFYRCSICNDWQIQKLPKCRRCFAVMIDDTEFDI